MCAGAFVANVKYMGTCGCGATWTGARMEHCSEPGCHQTFSGTASGDMHRTGAHHISRGPGRRRCLTADEMIAKGMVKNARGAWASKADSRYTVAT